MPTLNNMLQKRILSHSHAFISSQEKKTTEALQNLPVKANAMAVTARVTESEVECPTFPKFPTP